ncbi:MAG: DUF1801 domain-containing protein [Saprospiraceae bacterium]|nr:DUF1801 domain-containing protein [Saprospiraceae bacterium]
MLLEQIRDTIKTSAPLAYEAIKYDMPAFPQNGKNLVYFAAFKNHIGFYPVPTGNKDWDEILSPYKTGKGSIQFPYNKPIPLDLITKVVQFRLQAVNSE